MVGAVCLSIASIVAACRPAPPVADLIVLQTGRLRGNVYPVEMRGEFPLQHYPFLAGYVKAVRAEAARTGAEVLLVDLGDSLGGSFAAHVTRGRNMATLFNSLKYDAIALGNLDADIPPDVIPEIHAPVLCPFQKPDGSPSMPGTAAAVRFAKGRYSVTLHSNFYGDTPVESDPLRFPTSFGPDRAPARPIRDHAKQARTLPSVPGIPFTGLTWMKFEPGDHRPDGFLESLRALGVDLILAHRIYSGNQPEVWRTHQPPDWTPPVSENLLRANLGFTIARTDLKHGPSGWLVLRREVVPLTANTAPSDTEIRAAIEPFGEAIRRADPRVGTLDRPATPADIHRIYLGALTSIPDIELVACSPESIRTGWEAGTLRASHVFNSLPWTSPLLRVRIPADRLSELPKLRNLEVWRVAASGHSSGDLHLATSAFFAALLEQQLGLVDAEPLGTAGEYEFFLEFLRSQADIAAVSPGPGWSRMDE